MTKKYKLGIICATTAFALLVIGCIIQPHKSLNERLNNLGVATCIFLMILTLLPIGNDKLQ